MQKYQNAKDYLFGILGIVPEVVIYNVNVDLCWFLISYGRRIVRIEFCAHCWLIVIILYISRQNCSFGDLTGEIKFVLDVKNKSVKMVSMFFLILALILTYCVLYQ